MNNLRRLAAAILALMMLFALTATAFAESKTAENKAPVSKAPYEELAYLNGQLRVGMECAYAPYNWTQGDDSNGAVPIKDSDGEYANGYDVMMAKAICEANGWQLEIVPPVMIKLVFSRSSTSPIILTAPPSSLVTQL